MIFNVTERWSIPYAQFLRAKLHQLEKQVARIWLSIYKLVAEKGRRPQENSAITLKPSLFTTNKETVTEIVVNPDGSKTKTTATTRFAANGDKMVTKTTEQIAAASMENEFCC